jgi:hypothetical protein
MTRSAASIQTTIKAALFCAVFTAPSVSPAADADPKSRTFPADIQDALCQKVLDAPEFARAGVFDTQISVSRLKPASSLERIKETKVRELAMSSARDQHNLGFAYGLCGDGTAWIASTPSAEAITIKNNLTSVPGPVAAACARNSLQFRYVAATRGRSMIVPIVSGTSGALSAEMPQTRGVLGISCIFKSHPNDGPRELAMVPVAGYELSSKDLGLESVRSQMDSLDWINSRRKLEALPELKMNDALSDAATSSAGSQVIRHNLPTLATMTPKLLRKGLAPIGENRVVANSWSNAMALLWSSPFHRDLLLNAKSDAIGFGIRPLEQNQNLVTLILAQQATGSVSKLAPTH